jgi:hypothetical protein
MDTKRGAIVVGASLAALAAGWYIRRWYSQRAHEQELQSEEKVRDFDETINTMNKTKRVRRQSNGRHKTATT